MPRTKSVRAIIAEVVMYVGMFAVVGHLSQNLYERFLMQSALNGMKSDLNTLQLIVHNIGMAYDTLREDIHEFMRKESRLPLNPEIKARNIRPIYDSYLVHKHNQKHIVSMPDKQDMETGIEKCTQDFMQNFKRSTKNFKQYWNTPAKNETTFTECLIQYMNISVGTDKNDIKDFCKCIVKCISHKDDDFKVVNLHKDGNYEMVNSQKYGNHKLVKFSNEAKSKYNFQRATSNETNSTHPENNPVCDSFKTL